MGISNLHQQIRSICEPAHLSDFEGCTAAIDAFSWLHRGAQSCPLELCQGKPTSKFVSFCISRIELLQRHGVKPLLVFDGSPVSAKQGENSVRRRQREAALEKAVAAQARGDSTTARSFFARAVCVTHEMAHQLILKLQERGVPFLVAPYEADAQMAYLSRNGLADLVITEDSDALVFGCKRVLYKMDQDGNGLEVQLRNLGANTELSFVNWSPDMFLDMCLLAGCDYLPPVPGLGIKTAHRMVKEHRTPKRILEALKNSKFGSVLPSDFEVCFWRGRACFRHMRVYDPQTREDCHLTPIDAITRDRFPDWLVDDLGHHPGNGGSGGARPGRGLDFLGPALPPHVAQDIASGVLHPKTRQPWPSRRPFSSSLSSLTSGASSAPADGHVSQLHSNPASLLNQDEGLDIVQALAKGEESSRGRNGEALYGSMSMMSVQVGQSRAPVDECGDIQTRDEVEENGDENGDDNQCQLVVGASSMRGAALARLGIGALPTAADFKSPKLSDNLETLHGPRKPYDQRLVQQPQLQAQQPEILSSPRVQHPGLGIQAGQDWCEDTPYCLESEAPREENLWISDSSGAREPSFGVHSHVGGFYEPAEIDLLSDTDGRIRERNFPDPINHEDYVDSLKHCSRAAAHPSQQHHKRDAPDQCEDYTMYQAGRRFVMPSRKVFCQDHVSDLKSCRDLEVEGTGETELVFGEHAGDGGELGDSHVSSSDRIQSRLSRDNLQRHICDADSRLLHARPFRLPSALPGSSMGSTCSIGTSLLDRGRSRAFPNYFPGQADGNAHGGDIGVSKSRAGENGGLPSASFFPVQPPWIVADSLDDRSTHVAAGCGGDFPAAPPLPTPMQEAPPQLVARPFVF